MKIAVIYASKTGFTRKYAQWLGEALIADCFELHKTDEGMLNAYDILIFGGGLYAGGIYGLKSFRRMTEGRALSSMVFFATGATPSRADVVPEIRQINFSENEQKSVNLFYMRGGYSFRDLNIMDKVLMTLLKVKIRLKREADRTADERGMLAAYGRPVDFTRARHIEPLVACVKEIQGSCP